MTFIISAGHGLRDPGAVNGLLFEHLEVYQICWFLRLALERRGHAVDFISCFQSLSEKIAAVNKRAAESTIAAAVEIHLNSAEAKTANGTEVLYVSQAAQGLATDIAGRVSTAIGTRNRGAVKRTNLAWLTATKPKALIVEVLFISGDDSAKLAEPGFHQKAAEAIAEGLNGI